MQTPGLFQELLSRPSVQIQILGKIILIKTEKTLAISEQLFLSKLVNPKKSFCMSRNSEITRNTETHCEVCFWLFITERLWSGFGAVDKCLVLYWRCASWKWECVGQWRNLCFQRPSDVFLSQSRDCRLLVSCSLWEIRVSKSYVQIKLERNCLVFIIEGTGHGDAILKDGDWKWEWVCQ